MNDFTHINAVSVSDAVANLTKYGAAASVLAGGTDLLGEMQRRCLPTPPTYLINLKTIPNLDYIKEDAGVLKIGAMTRLNDIATNAVVLQKYTVLAQAARKVGSWQIRNMGTISGNICQQVRCWYFQSPRNTFSCLRKDPKGMCFALAGDNRYQHSVFGAASGCVAASVSDTAPALIALDASIVTNKRTLKAEAFFDGFKETVLAADEIVTEIQITAPATGSKQVFVKASIRKAVDFALASCAIVITPGTGAVTSARVVLGGVAPIPRRATKAEDALKGQTISSTVADTVAAAAVDGATALANNKYKIQMIKGIVKRALLS